MFRKVHLTHVTMDYLYPEGRLVIGKNYISFVDLTYIGKYQPLKIECTSLIWLNSFINYLDHRHIKFMF